MSCLNNLSGPELVTLANILSITLAQGLSTDEIASLAAFFTIVGDSLAALSLNSNISNNLTSPPLC